LLAAVIAALALAWFGVRWQIGNMLGELASPSQENVLEVAQAAAGLAPRDPVSRSLIAAKLRQDFTPESIEASVVNFEEAVRLSPNDFRLWIELGRAYEQADRFEDAERAFRRGVELAPEYTFPQWQIGNFYLRRGRADEAFAYLAKAAEKSIVYREQVFGLAWDYFEKDAARVEQLASDTPSVRVTLAHFYAQRGAADDALRVWNSIPESEKVLHPAILRSITEHLYSKRAYRQALEFSRQAGIDPEAEIAKVTNPGFEKFLGDVEPGLFGWKINRGDSKFEILTDSSVKAAGQRSLRLTFKNYVRPELFNPSQIVAVQPESRFRLTFMLRVENLRTGAKPMMEVVNANNDISIARTQPFPTGTHDWQPATVEFSVPVGCDGVTIRTVREPCGEICPISGTMWLDNFSLEKL